MKVRLKETNFMTEYPGGPRFPAGAVLDVPDATADKWYLLGIATKASPRTKTYAEEQRERKELEREEAELNAQPVYSAQMTREGPSPSEVQDMDEDELAAMAEDDDEPHGRKKK